MEKNKKLNIVFLSKHSGSVYRGVETYVHELSNKFVELGHNVIVYQSGVKLTNSFYKTITINDQNLFAVKALMDVSEGTDVLFATNGGYQSLFSKIWTFGKKTKLVIPGQSGLGRDDKFNLLCFPDLFIGLTEFQSNWARNFAPFVKVVTIPNGVDSVKFNPNGQKRDFGLKHPIVLSCGALEDIKRFDLVINAVSKLDSVSLLIVGKGSLKSKLEEQANRMMPGRFRIIESKYEDMPIIYRSCDLFTYSTQFYESFGIVMLEAMASNLPIVCSDDPIRKQIVGDAGYFVDPNNLIEYSSLIKKALNTKWGRKPFNQSSNFGWSKIAQKYIDQFDKIIK